MDAYRFAHLTDPHLPTDPGGVTWRDLISKRALSWFSWRRKRQYLHQPEILAATLADIAAHAPHHRVVTGDIANITVAGEFTAGRAWLEGIGSPNDVTYVPGNHDALVPFDWGRGLGLWAPWMAGDGADCAGPGSFPACRIRGPVAFVLLNSGLLTPIGMATGELGPAQIAATESMLADLGRRGLFRVVLLHHPAVPGAVPGRKGLTDGDALSAALGRVGAEILLHGHAHYAHWGTLRGPLGPIPCITLPSASARAGGHTESARWMLVEVSREEGLWRAALTFRGYDTASGGFATVGRQDLLLPCRDQ